MHFVFVFELDTNKGNLTRVTLGRKLPHVGGTIYNGDHTFFFHDQYINYVIKSAMLRYIPVIVIDYSF